MPTRFMNKGGYGDENYCGDERFLVEKNVVFEDVRKEEGRKGLVKNSCIKKNYCNSDESSSSSSIGKNSDVSENSMEKSGDGEEVQSSYKGPLDAMEALEEVLPIRRGISRFYNGKSKSFASLTEASSASSKDIAKPDNAYMRKRRNLLACNLACDKTKTSTSSPLRGNGGGGISKRVTSSSRTTTTTLALAVAMNNCQGDKKLLSGECNSAANAGSLLPLSSSLRNKDFSPWRSFSLADLQHCVSVAITCSNSNELATKPS